MDYALFDSNGDVAVLIEIQDARPRRRHDRIRLWERTRGMSHGLGVLTSGFCREGYDLSRWARNIDDKRVAALVLNPDEPDGHEHVADALFRWIDRDKWS